MIHVAHNYVYISKTMLQLKPASQPIMDIQNVQQLFEGSER
jgi:hypothetical protein